MFNDSINILNNQSELNIDKSLTRKLSVKIELNKNYINDIIIN